MDILLKTLEQNKEKYINRLTDLVKIDTHDIGHGIDGGLEKDGQDYMIKMFSDMGAEVVKDQMTEDVIEKSLRQYQEGNTGHNYEGRYNVYARFKGKGGKSLMFNGHIDTMPAQEELWSVGPHSGEIKDGKIYGLGVCDMKGGLMASAMAVELLKDAEVDLPGDVVITSVCDEEGGGNGSIIAAMNGQKADGVVVCEPTADELILAHMGFVFFEVEVDGLAVHSGSKWLGVSAIEKAIKLIGALNELEHTWLMTHKHRLLPSPSLNVGVITGGTAGSTLADKCVFKVCVHYHPNVMSYDSTVEEFNNAISLCSDGDSWLREHRPKVSVYQAGGPFEMDESHMLVDCFKTAYKTSRGKDVKVVGSPAGCDSRVWKTIAGCPVLQFGPGRLEECHAVDEYISADAYLQSILIYANLILEWCKK